ncbi:MAG: hypothetical protein GWN00_19600, partial [Aliifodinibius sp.]|nr:hypothetical protein [Fodinibius sp.]NIV13273.1 hypothetical protein [Fodinibius sp.]NIY26928.1 hypothetical protein [Fodinibius sp.]
MGGDITGNGHFEMGEVLTHTLDFTVNNIDLAQSWKGLYHETSPYQGEINGRINTSGPIETIDSLRFLANLTMQKMSFKNKPLPDFVVNVSLGQAVADLDIHQAESQIKAKVKLTDEQLWGDFSVEIFQLEPFAGLFNLMGLRGMVNVKGDISGTVESPNIRADFTAGQIRYQNIPLDTLRGS